MAGRLKKIFRSILFAIAVTLFAAVQTVDDINICLNLPVVKNLLVEYLQSAIQGTATVTEALIYTGHGIGISFNGVNIAVGEKFRLAADEVDLFFSIPNRINYGYWLKSIRLTRPSSVFRIDRRDFTKPDRIRYVPEIVVEDPDVTLYYGGHAVSLKGELTGHVAITPAGAGEIFGSGGLDIRSASVRFDNELAAVSGSIQLKRGNIAISDLAISVGKVTVTASGAGTIGSPGKFSGHVLINGLAIGSGGGGVSPFLSGVLGFFDGNASIFFTNMLLFGIPVDTVSARAEMKGGTMSLNDIRAAGAFFTGTGTMVVNPASSTRFDIAFSLQNYALESILRSLSASEPWAEGAINLQGKIWGTSGSINGDLFFSAFNGRIKRYAAVSKIFSAVNIYKIILNRNPGMKSKGFPYNSMLANVVIHDSVIVINDLYLDSNSVQMSALGTYSLRNRFIDMTIGLRPMESLDRVITALPVFGWVFKGKDHGFLVIDLKVTGNIEDFQVLPVPVRTVSRKVSDILLRTLMLPYIFFTNPEKLLPGLPDKK